MLFIHPAVLTFSIAYGMLYLYTGRFLPFNLFSGNKTDKLLLTSKLIPPNPTTPQPASSSILHIFKQAAICSDSQICSDIGRKILEKGGSAVDAALSTLICNGLTAMQSSGLGGGMLMNIYSHNEKRAYSILSREVAPLALRAEHYGHFQNASELSQSSLSIAVPAEVMGYAIVHEKFGKLPWSDLVQPTIDICNFGYILTKHQRDALQTNWIMVSQNPLLREMFVDQKTNELYPVYKFVRPPKELCYTYELLAKDGPRSFYNGKMAEKIANDLQDMGSLVDIKDLRAINFKVLESERLILGNYNLHFLSPPSSGYILALVMQILSNFYSATNHAKTMNTLSIHRIVEALKFAFVKRWEIDVGTDEEYLQNLTCPKYGSILAKQIIDEKTFSDPTHYGANLNTEASSDHGTAHISVLAPNGDAVSVTSSINYYFGSGRSGLRTGILFNNVISDFNIYTLPNYFDLPNLQDRNQIKPGQSPMSSMSPIIVTDKMGNVLLVVGAAGGSKIISALAQILVRTLWLGENIKEAIDAARFHHQLLPNVLEYEYGIQDQIVEELKRKGHHTERYRIRGSAVCGIQRNTDGSVYANADYRKEGGVAGF